MYAVVVKVQIKPENRKEFIEAMLDDARGSVKNEQDCLLFNVVVDQTDPNRLHLYEVYTSEDAFKRHTETPHFTKWLEVTKDWLAEPLAIATGTHIFPTDDRWKKQV